MEIKLDTWLLCSTTLTGSVPRWWRSSPTSSPSWPATELMLSASPRTPLTPTQLGSKLTSNSQLLSSAQTLSLYFAGAREASEEVWLFHCGVIPLEN